MLKAAHLSHHTTYGYEGSNFGNPNSSATMEYPERIGGYPRVWVAKFKHANYSTRAKCTAGGFGGLDHCDTYQYSAKWRFPVYSHHNLGSYSTRFIDCVDAEFQVGEHMECMWATSGKFRGWLYHPDQMLGGDQHGAKLQVFGFLN